MTLNSFNACMFGKVSNKLYLNIKKIKSVCLIWQWTPVTANSPQFSLPIRRPVNALVGREAPVIIGGYNVHETFRRSRSVRKFFWENSWENMNPYFFFTTPVKFNWYRNEIIKSKIRYFEFMESEKKNMLCTVSIGNKKIFLSVLWGTSKTFPYRHFFHRRIPL